VPQRPLDRAVALEALTALRAHGTVTKAAEQMGIPRATLESRLRTAKNLGITLEPKPQEQIRAPLATYDEAWTQFAKALGMAKDRYAGPAKPRKASTRQRIVAAGDFHVPFHDRAAVAELIAREAGHTDVLFIGGDFGDAQSASIFTKYDHVPFTEELAETKACLDHLSEAFPKIVYLRGSNHMDRVEKRIRENLDKDLVDAILYMTGGHLSPDLVLAKRYPNVEIACWETPHGQRVPWLAVMGDVAFSHAEKYSVTPGFATRKVQEWLDDFSGTLGLPEIRAVVQFHTHAMSLLPWRSDGVLIEPGCLCTTHGYQLRSKIGGRPQRVGYVVFEMEDGRIDFDSITLRWVNRKREAA
jgi:hypothetical protein